ncbi:hypothetical protein TSUD_380220 [Trifolium subterraneum]|uniref:Uncharacterized protein n=1 Tax=Trifolium subterraneum TaxID=3900 RepID=A0A2Z6NTU9_TRISU|nr:hypothetical protein TSUD_380220 [Trifolium subterraneum]
MAAPPSHPLGVVQNYLHLKANFVSSVPPSSEAASSLAWVTTNSLSWGHSGSRWQMVELRFGPFFRFRLFILARSWFLVMFLFRTKSVGVAVASGSVGFW